MTDGIATSLLPTLMFAIGGALGWLFTYTKLRGMDYDPDDTAAIRRTKATKAPCKGGNRRKGPYKAPGRVRSPGKGNTQAASGNASGSVHGGDSAVPVTFIDAEDVKPNPDGTFTVKYSEKAVAESYANHKGKGYEVRGKYKGYKGGSSGSSGSRQKAEGKRGYSKGYSKGCHKSRWPRENRPSWQGSGRETRR